MLPFSLPLLAPFFELLAECFANLFFIMYSGNRSLILVFHSYLIAEVRFLSVSGLWPRQGIKARKKRVLVCTKPKNEDGLQDAPFIA